MKQRIRIIMLTLFGAVSIMSAAAFSSAAAETEKGPGVEESIGATRSLELKGVWISYLTWNELPKDEAGFQAAVNQMFDNCKSWGMNAVFVHVRSHGDAMYQSSLFPWSKFASGKQGQSPGYDPFAYMVQAAHNRGLQIHAWFNPYRITGYLMPWEEISDQNLAKLWLSGRDQNYHRRVLKHQGEYYLNPSNQTVQNLVIDGVMEVVNRYDVDGIHFDDYFYPEVDDTNMERWFDKPEYDASGSSIPIWQWRRDRVSELVRGVHQAVKASKPDVVFGISPQGYVENLRSQNKLFVDIDRWMSQDGFVDYIMPQLYWGFEAKTSAKEPAPFAFQNNLNTWIQLKNRGSVKLYLGLGLYRAGSDVSDNNEVSEWLRCQDIIKRQVETARSQKEVSGFCFYSYDSFLQPQTQNEVSNLIFILR